MNKVRRKLLRLARSLPDICTWDDVIFALHMTKIMEPGYKAKDDGMILPPRDVMDYWFKEIERRERDLKAGKTKLLTLEEVLGSLKSRRAKKPRQSVPKKTPKQAALDAVRDLPDHAGWDDVEDAIKLRQDIEKRLR